MRGIKFRGKWVVNNRWLEGYGIKFIEGKNARLYTDSGFYEVLPESVGQYIGLSYEDYDVFEGELIKFKHKQSTDWDVAEIVYFGDMDYFGAYPAFDLNGQHIKHHHFEGNALSEIWDSGEYDIEFIGAACDKHYVESKGEGK